MQLKPCTTSPNLDRRFPKPENEQGVNPLGDAKTRRRGQKERTFIDIRKSKAD